MSNPIVRFAPSPTGKIHIGNARPALYNWLYAQKHGGQFVLRFDDTDVARSTKEFADGIERDLAWLGIVPDRKERQSERFGIYDEIAEKLKAEGKLYACYETPDEIDRRRKRLQARGLPPVYDRAGLKLTDEEKAAYEAEGRTPHWRFLLPNFKDDPFKPERTEVQWDDVIVGPQVVDLASQSDPVLIRGDGTYLYTLPSVIDDIEFGITHIIRGGDHITNTGVQISIFKALGGTPPQFGHHNLLTMADGEGLSKRKGSLSLESLREEGFEAMAVASLAVLLGTSQAVEPCANMDVLVEKFDEKSVTKSAAKFDTSEVGLLNAKLVHQMDYAQAKSRLEALGCDGGETFWNAVRGNIKFLPEAKDWYAIIHQPVTSDLNDEDKAFITIALENFPEGDLDSSSWSKWTGILKEKTDRKGRGLFMPLRQALTGMEHGPELATLLPLIGGEQCKARLSAASK